MTIIYPEDIELAKEGIIATPTLRRIEKVAKRELSQEEAIETILEFDKKVKERNG